MSNYPDNVGEFPQEMPMQTYIFEAHGEVLVDATSEEEAQQVLENDMKELLYEAVRNGDLLIER